MPTKVDRDLSVYDENEYTGSKPSGTSGNMTDGIKVDIHGSMNAAANDFANKLNTSASRDNQGKPTKGGGSPYATGSNFSPAQAGGSGSSSRDSDGYVRDKSGRVSDTPGTMPGDAGMNPETAEDLNRLARGEKPLSNLSDNDPRFYTPSNAGAVAGDENYSPQYLKDLEASEKGKQIPSNAKDPNAGKAGTLPGDNKTPGFTKDLKSLENKQAQQKSILLAKGSTKQKLKGKLKQFAKKKAGKIIGGTIGIGGAFFLLMLLFFLLGTLLIPHFMSNVIGWQFVKVTRAAYESTQEVLEEQMGYQAETAAEKAATDSADDISDNSALQSEKALTPEEMDKAAENMDGSTALKENAKDGQLDSVTYEDQNSAATTTEDVNGNFENGEIQPPSIMDNPATAENVTSDETKLLDLANPTQGDGAVYQDVTPTVLEGEAGAAPSGLDPDEKNYQDDASAKAAEEQVTDDAYATDNDIGGQTSSGDSQINKDSQEADSELATDMSNPSEVAQIVADDGNLPTNLINLLNSDFVQSALDSVASKVGEFLNPATGKLIPFCIVDEGSKYSGPTAQAQSSEVQRSFILMAAVSDQEKRGSPYVTSNMVGAVNWKLEGDSRAGGVTRSIPLERASGEKVTTTSQLSTEGSPLGNLQNSGNILSALGVPFAGTLQGALDTICPAITNIWVNLGLGVANLTFLALSAIFTGGAGDAAEAAADGGADEAANVVTTGIVSRLIANFSSKTVSSGFDILKDFGKNVVIGGGLTALATFAAKFYVMSQAGITYSGITTGPAFDNGVDQGGNEIANATVANAYGGRPLTNTEAMEVNQDDNKTLAEINASQSSYQRYLALSNPQSLASVLSDRVASNLNYGFFGSILADIGNIFNPASLMPQVIFGGVSGQANAAADVDTADYGDVQQGWSDAEYALIAATPSYKSPAENQYILNQSGDETTVDQTYGPCFDDSVATLLSLQTNGTPDIVRDANGNISETEGLCSPQNLGPNNPQYGDLVFRYRLARSYNTSLNIIQGLANAT
jgi:hypothetical protein